MLTKRRGFFAGCLGALGTFLSFLCFGPPVRAAWPAVTTNDKVAAPPVPLHKDCINTTKLFRYEVGTGREACIIVEWADAKPGDELLAVGLSTTGNYLYELALWKVGPKGYCGLNDQGRHCLEVLREKKLMGYELDKIPWLPY